MKPLNGKLVVVTGAASGIGLECARSFAKRGARIVMSDVNEAALENSRSELAASGASVLAFACNVADEESVKAFAAAVQREAGVPDVLVSNAGIAFLGSFMETGPEQWRRILDVNVMGIVHCVRAFLPAMRAAGGPRKIVNVASTAGFTAIPNLSAYVASKHAVMGLSDVLALELHDTEVSVLTVCPGIIDTQIVQVSSTAPSISQAQAEKLQTYYRTKGCKPAVVAEDVVRAVETDAVLLPTGPSAWAGYVACRLPRKLARRLFLAGARESGYLY